MSELEKRVPASKRRRAWDFLVKAWDEIRELERSNPPVRTRVRAKLRRKGLPQSVEVHTWLERDRAHVEVRDTATDETVIEWWDEAVTEAIEDGFLDPRKIETSAVQVAIDAGLLPKDVKWRAG